MGHCANPADGKNHSRAYFERTGNKIFVNIKMTPKAEAEDGQAAAQKVTKLAIGKPGGIDADTDKFDTTCTVSCYACQKELPLTNPKVASMVDSILLAQSAYCKDATTEWELELNPCPHTLEMD